MSGPTRNFERPEIRKLARVSDPTEVDRVLGVHHHCEIEGTVTKVNAKLKANTQQAIEMYQAVLGHLPLRLNVQTNWHEPAAEELSKPQRAEAGCFKSACASLLMHICYMARVVRMDLTWAFVFSLSIDVA